MAAWKPCRTPRMHRAAAAYKGLIQPDQLRGSEPVVGTPRSLVGACIDLGAPAYLQLGMRHQLSLESRAARVKMEAA